MPKCIKKRIKNVDADYTFELVLIWTKSEQKCKKEDQKQQKLYFEIVRIWDSNSNSK